MDPREKMIGRSAMGALAHQYVALADGVMQQTLGRVPTDGELSDFGLNAVSQLLGALFVILYDKKGAAEAEKWLKKTLAMTSGVIRLEGSDALIKFEVELKEIPNTNRRRPAPAPVPAGIPACACDKTEDGDCPSCRMTLKDRLWKAFSAMREMARLTSELRGAQDVRCRECELAHTDRVLASLVPDFLALGKGLEGPDMETVGQELLGLIYQVSVLNGVTELPLTEAAWKASMQEKKGGAG